MPDFQFYFELLGAVAFAVSGAALAVKKGMDLFGVAVMGMTTAVGGGILRDMLLGLTPPAALKDPLQALVAIATSLLLFIVWKKWHPSGNHRVWESVLLAADSLGLGIFSVHGAAVAIRAGYGANGAAGGRAHRRGRRRPAGRVLHGAAVHLHQACVRLCVAGRRGGVHGAVEHGRELRHADGLRCDAGAAHLRRRVPLEPAQGVIEKTASAVFLRQYRIMGQERFASKFCVLTRRGFAAILAVLQEIATKSGRRISAKRRSFSLCGVAFITP